MKSLKKLLTTTIAASVAVSTALLLTTSGLAHADCFQYTTNNFQTSTTPVFDNICGVPTLLSSTNGQYALGDESNFVRIRPDVSGDDTSNATNPALTNSLTAACDAGQKFDIWTYIHNDASQAYNDLDANGNPVPAGTGSAVAHNVKLALNAPINTENSTFNFGSTVSASNAASVSDSTTLNCGGKQVQLTLVANSVHYNNDLSQPTYSPLSDSAVNGTIPVGSPTFPGSGQTGDELGCWNYRIEVVYQVEVQPLPAPQVTATCNLFALTASDNRKVVADQFSYTATNADFKSLVVNWGDNSAPTVVTNPNEVINQLSHEYAANGQYTVVATVHFSTATNPDISATSPNCEQPFTFTSSGPVTPQTPPTAPTALVNTGPGSMIGLFAATTLGGAAFYRRLLARRLSRQ